MLFSIIMPAYNPGVFLKKSIQSVLDQSCPDWELIIINDGSTDETDATAKTFARQDDRIRYYVQENRGVSKTRNRAIDLAAGEYILFVDADDEISPETLETVRNTLNTDPCDIVVFNTYRSNVDSKVTGKVTHPFADHILKLTTEQEKKQYIYTALASNRTFALMGNFVAKRELLLDIRFPTDMVTNEDLLFDIQMYEKASSVVCLPEYFYYYRNNPTGSVRNFNYQKLADIKRAFGIKQEMVEKHGLTHIQHTPLLFYCGSVLSFYCSLLEDRKRCKEYVSYVQQDQFILDQFETLKTIPLPGNFPNVKYLLGNIWERTYLRYRFLLRKRIKHALMRFLK